MLHIFVSPGDIQEEHLTITGGEVNHIKNVLRMKQGDEISVSTGEDAMDYHFEITEIGEDEIFCHLLRVQEKDAELPVKVYLFQGLPKADKMELVIQKAVELGVYAVIPVSCARSVVKLDEKREAKKIARWQSIAESAAMQSKRRIIPQVYPVMSMKEALEFAKSNTQVRVIPYELQPDDGSTKEILEGIRPGESVSVFIGPEGGFEEAEVSLAGTFAVKPISLGRRILRTETAGLAFLSWLTYIFEIT